MKIYKEEQRKSNHTTKNKGQVWHRCTTAVTFDLSFSPLCLLMTVCEFEGEDDSCLSHSNLSNLSRSVCSRWHTTLQLMANDRMINGYVYARTHKNMWGRLMWKATVQTHTSTASVYHLLSKGLLFFHRSMRKKMDMFTYAATALNTLFIIASVG